MFTVVLTDKQSVFEFEFFLKFSKKLKLFKKKINERNFCASKILFEAQKKSDFEKNICFFFDSGAAAI